MHYTSSKKMPLQQKFVAYTHPQHPMMSAPTTPHQFGQLSVCTEEQLTVETQYLFSSCALENVGNFYFVHSLNRNGRPSKEVYLKFFDKELGLLHCSEPSCFSTEYSKDSPATIQTRAINPHVFLLTATSWKGVCILDAPWKFVAFQVLGNAEIANMASFFKSRTVKVLPITDIHRTGLARIRNGSPGDFWLKSDDGESIEVHKTVLKPLWPFFAAALDSNMKEASENSIDLPFPKSAIEVAVRYLYGQPLKMEFDQAANLLVMAQMYDLPELLRLATARTKSGTLDARQAILLWKKSFEASNEKMRSYAIVKVKQFMPEISDSKLLEGLDREELVSLLMDISSRN